MEPSSEYVLDLTGRFGRNEEVNMDLPDKCINSDQVWVWAYHRPDEELEQLLVPGDPRAAVIALTGLVPSAMLKEVIEEILLARRRATKFRAIADLLYEKHGSNMDVRAVAAQLIEEYRGRQRKTVGAKEPE